MVFLGLRAGILADHQQLHCMTREEEVVNGGGGVVAVLQPLRNDMEEEENEIENMATTLEREKEELLPYLDEGIITKILVKVHSAESLYNSLRYVCKPWSDIISHNPDIYLNFLLPSSKPPCIIIIQNADNISRRLMGRTLEEEFLAPNVDHNSYTTCLLKMGIREGHVQLEQQVDLTQIFKKLCIRDCSNGLVLATTPDRITLCIVNPLTNHMVVLPSRTINADSPPQAVRFAFLPSTGKYKVVTMDQVRHDKSSLQSFLQILTMSSSPAAAANGNTDPCRCWRVIEPPDPLTYGPALAIKGVYYWPQSLSSRVHYIISFDVAAERFYSTPHKLYNSVEQSWLYNGFMDLEGYLAFWSFRPVDGAGEEAEADRRTFNVHVIEDLHEKGGEWKELYSGVRMDLDVIKADRVIPCLSFGNGEVMIFRNRQGGNPWAYHFKSQQWLKVGNNLKELDFLNFWGYIVRSSNTPMPFDSLFSLKQTTGSTSTKK